MNAAHENFVVLLVDESSAMSSVMRDKLADGTESTKTNAERVATSVNNLLKQLSEGPACEVAVVGYRSDADGQADVGCRWVGTLAGREFVATPDLAAAARTESRTRRVPQADGTIREEQVLFPVWYEPALGSKAPQIAAFKFCRDLIGRRAGAGGEALLIHVFSGASGDGNPQKAVEELLNAAAKPVLVQCHVAASSALVTTAFPSKQVYLSAGLAKDLFNRCSELPAAMRTSLQAAKVATQTAARGLVHNAKMADLFRCLQLAKVHVAGNTAAASPPIPVQDSAGLTPPGDKTSSPGPIAGASPAHAGEPVGLLVLILDRSVEDPFGGNMQNPCSRLQEAGNEILKQVSTKDLGSLAIDVAIVSYGLGADGQPDVRSAFDGPLAGQTVVRNAALPGGAIRVEESETQVSNGVGGLITIKKKTPIYFDVEPAGAVPPQAAFSAAAGIVAAWCGQHPTGLPPIVLHLTRGSHSAADSADAAALLSAAATASGPVRLHHLVITEGPHKSFAYPDSEAGIESDALQALWQASSPLLDWEKLQAAKRPYLAAGSRGFVVNGKFDLVGEEFSNALAPATA